MKTSIRSLVVSLSAICLAVLPALGGPDIGVDGSNIRVGESDIRADGPDDHLLVSSPDGEVIVAFLLSGGKAFYSIGYGDVEVVERSRLGVRLQDRATFDENLQIVQFARRTVDETWEQPWGEVRRVRNHFNELSVDLKEMNGDRLMRVVVFEVEPREAAYFERLKDGHDLSTCRQSDFSS